MAKDIGQENFSSIPLDDHADDSENNDLLETEAIDPGRNHPSSQSSIFGYLYFNWMDPLIDKCNDPTRTERLGPRLSSSDLFPLPRGSAAEELHEAFITITTDN